MDHSLVQEKMRRFNCIFNGPKVWVAVTDVKEILFPECSPWCQVVTHSLEMLTHYPESQEIMRQATEIESKLFLQKYWMVCTGSRLLDYKFLLDNFMALLDKVGEEHKNEREKGLNSCLYLEMEEFSARKNINCSDTGDCQTAETAEVARHSKDIPLPSEAKPNIKGGTAMLTVQHSEDKTNELVCVPFVKRVAEKILQYVPLCYLLMLLPELQESFQSLLNDHMICHASRHRICRSTPQEGQCLTRWFLNHLGWEDVHWRVITSHAVLVNLDLIMHVCNSAPVATLLDSTPSAGGDIPGALSPSEGSICNGTLGSKPQSATSSCLDANSNAIDTKSVPGDNSFLEQVKIKKQSKANHVVHASGIPRMIDCNKHAQITKHVTSDQHSDTEQCLQISSEYADSRTKCKKPQPLSPQFWTRQDGAECAGTHTIDHNSIPKLGQDPVVTTGSKNLTHPSTLTQKWNQSNGCQQQQQHIERFRPKIPQKLPLNQPDVQRILHGLDDSLAISMITPKVGPIFSNNSRAAKNVGRLPRNWYQNKSVVLNQAHGKKLPNLEELCSIASPLKQTVDSWKAMQDFDRSFLANRREKMGNSTERASEGTRGITHKPNAKRLEGKAKGRGFTLGINNGKVVEGECRGFTHKANTIVIEENIRRITDTCRPNRNFVSGPLKTSPAKSTSVSLLKSRILKSTNQRLKSHARNEPIETTSQFSDELNVNNNSMKEIQTTEPWTTNNKQSINSSISDGCLRQNFIKNHCRKNIRGSQSAPSLPGIYKVDMKGDLKMTFTRVNATKSTAKNISVTNHLPKIVEISPDAKSSFVDKEQDAILHEQIEETPVSLSYSHHKKKWLNQYNKGTSTAREVNESQKKNEDKVEVQSDYFPSHTRQMYNDYITLELRGSDQCDYEDNSYLALSQDVGFLGDEFSGSAYIVPDREDSLDRREGKELQIVRRSLRNRCTPRKNYVEGPSSIQEVDKMGTKKKRRNVKGKGNSSFKRKKKKDDRSKKPDGSSQKCVKKNSKDVKTLQNYGKNYKDHVGTHETTSTDKDNIVGTHGTTSTDKDNIVGTHSTTSTDEDNNIDTHSTKGSYNVSTHGITSTDEDNNIDTHSTNDRNVSTHSIAPLSTNIDKSHLADTFRSDAMDKDINLRSSSDGDQQISTVTEKTHSNSTSTDRDHAVGQHAGTAADGDWKPQHGKPYITQQSVPQWRENGDPQERAELFDLDGRLIGGYICIADIFLPFAVMNGYKFVALANLKQVFPGCTSKCPIIKSCIKKYPGLLRSFCNWEQVQVFESLSSDRRSVVSTGDILVRWDSLMQHKQGIKDEICHLHINSTRKSSKLCQYSQKA